MQFTKSEMNIMEILWADPDGLTSYEITASPKKCDSWKEQTFFVILKGLINKSAVEVIPNWKNNNRGRLYKAKMTIEEYYGQLLAGHKRMIRFGDLFNAYIEAKVAQRNDK